MHNESDPNKDIHGQAADGQAGIASHSCISRPSTCSGGSVGFFAVFPEPRLLATEPLTSSHQPPSPPPAAGAEVEDKDDSLLQFLYQDLLEDDGGGGMTLDGSSDGNDEWLYGGNDDLEDLMMPATCTRSISGLSLASEHRLTAAFEAGDDSLESWEHSITRVGNWLDGKDDDECGRDIEEVSKLVTVGGEGVAGSPDGGGLGPWSGSIMASLPAPRTSAMDWSAYVAQRSSGWNRPSGSGVFVIPRLSREILVEGMGPSAADVKKQKIARYLEKRKRRLQKKKTTVTTQVTYKARREIANKRARNNGRFVSTSEFGQASRRRR